MIITINYNDDQVTLEKGGRITILGKFKEIDKVGKLLDEILNEINPLLSVSLIRVDEDTRSIIGEW